MPTVEERLAWLEARMGKMDDLQNLVAALRDDMNRELTQVREDMNGRFAEMRADMRSRFEQIDRRCAWILGVQMALMLAVIGTLPGAYVR